MPPSRSPSRPTSRPRSGPAPRTAGPRAAPAGAHRSLSPPVTLALLAALAGSAGGCACREAPAAAAAIPGASPVVHAAADLTWEQVSPEVAIAVLAGDPQGDGPFALRLRFTPGYRKGPHVHGGDAFGTVLSGELRFGEGPVFDAESAHRMGPGAFARIPAGAPHYEWTEVPTEVELHSIGPWRSTFVDEGGRPLDPTGGG